jgi:predicted membrane protein DUF2306
MAEMLQPPTSAVPATRRFPLWILSGFFACIAIAVAVVIRRLAALEHPSSGLPQMVQLDALFASHAALTLAHIIPALVFVLAIPLYYSRRFADDSKTHLWIERSVFLLGTIVGMTAYAMSTHAVGGWIERSAVLFFNSLFLYSLSRSYFYSRNHERLLSCRWMTRALGILLGIATTRPVMGIFFATSALTHLQPKDFFGIAFWIGFSLNTLVVEIWLRKPTTLTHLEGLATSRS